MPCADTSRAGHDRTYRSAGWPRRTWLVVRVGRVEFSRRRAHADSRTSFTEQLCRTASSQLASASSVLGIGIRAAYGSPGHARPGPTPVPGNDGRWSPHDLGECI